MDLPGWTCRAGIRPREGACKEAIEHGNDDTERDVSGSLAEQRRAEPADEQTGPAADRLLGTIQPRRRTLEAVGLDDRKKRFDPGRGRAAFLGWGLTHDAGRPIRAVPQACRPRKLPAAPRGGARQSSCRERFDVPARRLARRR